MSLTKVTYSMIKDAPVNVLDFGAVGDGITDDTNAFLSAISEAELYNKPLYIPKTSASYKLTSGLTFDVWKTFPTSDGANLDFSSLTSGKALTFTSTVPLPMGSSQYAYTTEIGGFSLTGDITQSATTGIYVSGDVTNKYVAQLLFTNISIFGFANNIELGKNQWRIKFSHCNSMQPYYNHIYSNDVGNSGEVQQFENVEFHGGSANPTDQIPKIKLNSGQYFFTNCSFLIASLYVYGNSHTVCIGCNFEAPGYGSSPSETGYRYGYCTGSAYLELKGCCIVQSNPSVWEMALFYCDVYNGAGMAFDGTVMPMGDGQNPQITDNVKTFVAGNGRVQLKGGDLYSSFGARDFYPIAKSCNLIYNGDAETGNTNGWTKTDVWGSGTFTASAAAKKNGSYGFSLVGAVGTNTYVSQTFSVTPGRAVFCSMWWSGISGSPKVRLEGYSADGTITIYNERIGSAGPWVTNIGYISAIIPMGTVSCKFIVQCAEGSSVYFDDVVVNQI